MGDTDQDLSTHELFTLTLSSLLSLACFLTLLFLKSVNLDQKLLGSQVSEVSIIKIQGGGEEARGRKAGRGQNQGRD